MGGWGPGGEMLMVPVVGESEEQVGLTHCTGNESRLFQGDCEVTQLEALVCFLVDLEGEERIQTNIVPLSTNQSANGNFLVSTNHGEYKTHQLLWNEFMYHSQVLAKTPLLHCLPFFLQLVLRKQHS